MEIKTGYRGSFPVKENTKYIHIIQYIYIYIQFLKTYKNKIAVVSSGNSGGEHK